MKWALAMLTELPVDRTIGLQVWRPVAMLRGAQKTSEHLSHGDYVLLNGKEQSETPGEHQPERNGWEKDDHSSEDTEVGKLEAQGCGRVFKEGGKNAAVGPR